MLSFTAPKFRIVISFAIAAIVAGIAWNYIPASMPSSAAGKSAPAVKRGPATIVLQDGYDLPAVFDQARPSGDARPTTLATADFDVDGFPDLVSGFATGKGGYLVIQRGNPEAFAPTQAENVQAFNESRFLDSFLPQAKVIELTNSPDFIAVGDFNRDNDIDVITAKRGGTELDLITGNGKGEFSGTGKIALPGRVTTLAHGQIDQNDTFNDLVVGVEGESASLLVYEDAKTGVFGSAARYELPAVAQAVVLAEMDGTMWKDAAILAGGDVFILHGRNQSEGFESTKSAASRLEHIELPFASRAMTVGEFIWDREGRKELALLRDDGVVTFAAMGELDTRPFSIAEVRDRRRRQNLPVGDPERLAGPTKVWRQDASMKWQVAEDLTVVDPAAVNAVGENSSATLFAAQLSGQAADDLVIVDGATRQLKVFAVEAPAKNGDEYVSHAGPRIEMALPATNRPVAALSMRTSLFVRPGIIFLKEGSNEPEIIPASPSATFTVTKVADTNDGICNADCSLREAHVAANGAAGADTISIPAGTYTMTIANGGGTNEDTGATGDLDVTQDTTVSGAGAATTVMQGGTTNANGIDKVVGFNPFCAAVSGTVNNVTVRFGNNTQPDGSSDFSHTGGGLDYCGFGASTIAITNSTFDQNTVNNSYGGGINFDSLAPSTSNQQITNCTISTNDTVNAGSASGGGVNIFGDQSVVTITGTTISGNRARLTGTDGRGGGVFARVVNGGSVTINTSTISNNNASSSGGGVANAPSSGTQSFSMSNSSVTGNTSNGNGAGSRAEGGGFYNNSISSGTVTITESTFTGNTAVAVPVGGVHIGGGGLAFGANNAAATLSFSRIFGNTATSGTGARKDNNAGTVTATNNWWGCSGGPGTTGCDTAVLQGAPGVLTTSPFLQLRTSASPTTVVIGQTSALTASFLLNSAGGAVAASNLDTLIGQTVTWSGVNGSISGAQTTIQAAGTATATYTGTSAGAGSATAQVDGGPASGSLNTVAITVNPASTTASITSDSPDPSNVGQNVTVAYSVAVTAPGGGTPTGNVQVSDGVNSCTGTVAAGQCTVALNTAGNRTLTATYLGDGANYNPSPPSAGAGHLVGTVTWTGATNSTFATNTNWNTGLAPGAGDTVIIPTGATNQPTIGSAASVSSLSVASGRILTVNSTLTVSGTLTNNGTIGGTGTIVNNFTNGASGIVAPGLSPGIFNITGNYTNAGAMNVEIGGTGGAGVNPNGHDQLLVSGTATIGGTLNVTLTNGFNPAPGDVFVILDAASSTGTFATTNLPNIAPNQWTVQYDNPSGTVRLRVLSPTAAAASISGRVLTAENSGISRASVSVTAPNGTVYRATTNSFGYFRVEGLPTGATYTVTVTRKGYQFGQRFITLSQDVVDLDIIAIE